MHVSVVTKSFAPDYELCVALNRSVLEFFPNTVEHQIIVPRPDMPRFRALAGARTRIRCDSELLPRTFARLPLSNITLNLTHPFPPIRGWIQQQLVKVAAVADSNADVVLTIDSDVEFIKPVAPELFIRDGAVRFFRNPGAITAELSRHTLWHNTARTLLGLPIADPPFSDYISSYLAWDPKIVRQMLTRVEGITARAWTTAIASQLNFSECILYGIYVENLADIHAKAFASKDPLCHAYWNETPLDRDTVDAFIKNAQADDIAAMISAKSLTPQPIREFAFTELRRKFSQID